MDPRLHGGAELTLQLLFALLGAPASPATEEEVLALVVAAQDGDSQAAERLFTMFVSRLHRAVRPMCLSDAEAEDVVQDTFVKAFGALARYRPRGQTRFVSWLLTIARNTGLKAARRRRFATVTEPSAMVVLSEERDGALDDDPSEALDRARAKAALLAALEALPEREREVISLRYGAELPANEVASLVGISEANVRKICQRQRSRLVKEVEARLASSRESPS